MIVKEIQFKSGAALGQESLKAKTGTITIFVGPNNSGKTMALNEIYTYCETGKIPGGSPVLNDVHFSQSLEGWGEQEFQKIYREPLPEETLPNDQYCFCEIGGKRLQVVREQLMQGLTSRHVSGKPATWFSSYWLKHYVKNLDGVTRLRLVETQAKGDLTRPKTSFARLLRDDKLRDELWKKVFDAVGIYPFLHNLVGDKLSLVASNTRSTASERSTEEDTVQHVQNSVAIETFSDGILAFIGVLIEARAGNPEIICIDEPEAFLHPGLAETLGRELCKAAKDGEKQLFVATHSPHFLTGAIQSGADINVVRLTYQDGIGTARLMPEWRIRELTRKPKYRSVGMLSALFANHVVVTEGDSDKALYEEVHVRMATHDLGKSAANTVFLNARTKDLVGDIILPLREMGIPAAGVLDLDILKKNYTKLLATAGIPATRRDELSVSRTSALKILDGVFGNGNDGERQPWHDGIDKLSGDDKDTIEALLSTLMTYGLFVVPKGELEDWLKDLGVRATKKEKWLEQIFDKLGDDPNGRDYVSPSEDDVWEFMRKIEAWLKDPNRKGIPTATPRS